MPKLLIVIASTRPGRVGKPVARLKNALDYVIQPNEVTLQAAAEMLDELAAVQAALRPLRAA